MSNLLVKAALEGSAFSGEQVSARLPIEPGMYSDLTELTLSNLHPTAELTVFVPAAAQADMEVRGNRGFQKNNDALVCVRKSNRVKYLCFS